MRKTVIISGHPRLSHSTSNRLILQGLTGYSDIIINDIRSEYPDGNIDIQAEQEKLKNASLIVFQFPFIWYGMPSHMRYWLENVFSHGFAYGSENALRNKYLLLSVTLGGSSKDYHFRGKHRNPVETFLKPVQLFAQYCGLIYLPPVYSYNMGANIEAEGGTIEQRAAAHAGRILKVIRSLHPEVDNNAAIVSNQTFQKTQIEPLL